MNKIGVYGLGVMGKALAANILSKGFSLSVCNQYQDQVDEFVKDHPSAEGSIDLKSFVESLEKPRKIILMITAGPAIDEVCAKLVPYLDKDDILIDFGNSFFDDSERRMMDLSKLGIHFIGSGVSGGEKGALLGPSIMPSGEVSAYREIQEVFESIAAHNDDGSSCCTYIGKGGAGHFVKMVHNGIEYADMQLIAETYAILQAYKQDLCYIQSAFTHLQNHRMNSYLFDITCHILKKKEDGNYLLQSILDVARQKGTGKWTAQISLDYGVTIPSIIESVQARFLSAQKDTRVALSEIYPKQTTTIDISLEDLEKALYVAKICIYAQGFDLIQTVSKEKNYDIDMRNLGVIWQNGCIIKSEFLKEIVYTYTNESELPNLLFANNLKEAIKQGVPCLRNLVIQAKMNGLYIPLLNSALDYLDGMSCAMLSTNLIQAQRDCFGAHTYERIDKEGSFHSEW